MMSQGSFIFLDDFLDIFPQIENTTCQIYAEGRRRGGRYVTLVCQFVIGVVNIILTLGGHVSKAPSVNI